ncbi:MAG: GAF domain-containing protein [Acidobacteriota bacterium]
MAEEPGSTAGEPIASAVSELAECENLAQTSSWAARWGSRASGAPTVLVWTPDPTHPLFVCTGGSGEGARPSLKRSVPREDPIAAELLRDRDRAPLLLSRADMASRGAAWLPAPPADVEWVMFVAAETEGAVPAILTLLFTERPQAHAVAERLRGLLVQAAKALGRAVKSERKTSGMRQAIERLTALYDLSKAFGSTLEWSELNGIIVRKAVDFAGAEAGSLWLLDSHADSAELAATAINESYDVVNPPPSVGGGLVGDLLAEGVALRRNRISPEDPMSDPEFPVRSALGVALVEQDVPLGALVLVNKRGRVPDFSEEDQELLEDLARQAVRALRNARQFEAEKKVEELDALLAVSREITATLDLDRVMQTVVNASAALIRYDRCAMAIQHGGRLRLGAVSGTTEIDRRSPEIRRTEEFLQWVFLSGSEVNVTEREDGTLTSDRPETEEKFRTLFNEQGLKAFYAVTLKDDEGKLGVLAFESREPIVFDAETRDLLQILVNQATVAVRNAQLYQQVPLAGFWKPLLARRSRLMAIPRRRRLAWAAGAIALAAILFLVPWRLRVGGAARVLPGRRSVVTAGAEGIVAAVMHREGEVVPKGEIIATVNDESYRSALAEAQSAEAIAARDVATQQGTGNAAGLFDAQSRVDELKARIAMEQERFDATRLRAPAAGVIVTPRLEERIGQNLPRGAEFCVIADVGTVTVEIAVPEEDSSLLKAGQRVDVKLNPYPTRTFRGEISRVGARIREEGKERFVVAELTLPNPDGSLKTGMLGRGKISAGDRRIATLLLRKPSRWLYAKLWPLLP